jgi:hypothetical protein
VCAKANLDTVEEETLFSILGIEAQFLGHPACSVVATPSELSWLQTTVILSVLCVVSNWQWHVPELC